MPTDQVTTLDAAGPAAGQRHDRADAANVTRRTRPSPGELGFRACLAQVFVERGDAVSAAAYLTPEMAGDDPQLVLAVAEIQLRGGNASEAVALIERLMAGEPSLSDDVARLAVTAARRAAEAGFRLLRLAADHWLAHSQRDAAVAAVEAFVAAAPTFAPGVALLREIDRPNAAAAMAEDPVDNAGDALHEPPMLAPDSPSAPAA